MSPVVAPETCPEPATGGLSFRFPDQDRSVLVYILSFLGAIALFTVSQAYFRLQLGLVSLPTLFLLGLVILGVWAWWLPRRKLARIAISADHLILDLGRGERQILWEQVEKAGYLDLYRGDCLVVFRMKAGRSPGAIPVVIPATIRNGVSARTRVLDELSLYTNVCHRFGSAL